MSLALLIVDDDADVLTAASLTLARIGTVDQANSPEALKARIAARAYDAVLLDMNFTLGERSGREGFDCLAHLIATDPNLSVLLMTTYGGVALAVEALKRGAVDFVLKPWRNEALVAAVEAAAARTAERRRAGEALNLDDLEKAAIVKALVLHHGNISQAATALGLTRPALYRRMERHGL